MNWRRNRVNTTAAVIVAVLCAAGAARAAETQGTAGTPPAKKSAEPAKPPAAAKPAAPQGAMRPDAPVAKVNGAPLLRRDFDLMVQIIFRKRGTGERSHADLEAVRQAALDILIDNELLYQKAKEAGITVTDAEAKEEAERMKKALGGPETSAAFLKDIGATEADLVAQVRRTISIGRFVDQKVAGAIDVGEKEARAWYDAHPEMMKRPEAAHIRQIVVQVAPEAAPAARAAARQKIEEILKSLRGGEDFAALAKRHSEGAEAARGGDGGWISAGSNALPAVERAAMTLKPGQTSDILESRRGYHIVQVIERRPAGTLPFEDAKERIVARLKDEERQTKVKAYVATLRSSAR